MTSGCKNTFFWSVLRGSVDRRHKHTNTGAHVRTRKDITEYEEETFLPSVTIGILDEREREKGKRKKRDYDGLERKESGTTTTTTTTTAAARVVKRERGRTIKSTGRVPTLPLELSRNLARHSRVEAYKIPFSFLLG